MTKTSYPNLYSKIPYEMGQDFLDIQYLKSFFLSDAQRIFYIYLYIKVSLRSTVCPWSSDQF